MELKEILQKFGFSDKEIDVYVALIALGSAIGSDIAQKAGLNRSTTYVILDSLAKHELIKVTEERGIKLFSLSPRPQVVEHFKALAKRYAQLAEKLESALPEFKYKKVGIEKAKTVYEEALSSLENIRRMSTEEKLDVIIENPALVDALKKALSHSHKQNHRKPRYGL